GDERGGVGSDADATGDLGRGRAVVACDDDDPDSGLVAAGHGIRDFGSGRIERRDETQQRQVRLDVFALGWNIAVRKRLTGDGEDAESLPSVSLDGGQSLVAAL